MKKLRSAALASLFAGLAFASLAPSATSAQPEQSPPDSDPLASIVVNLTSDGKPLPKLGIIPSLSADTDDVTLNSIARRDLDLSGEFEIMPDSATPDGAYSDAVDVKAWKSKGAEYLVRVTAKKVDDSTTELRGVAYDVMNGGESPIYDKKFSVPSKEIRVESHHLTDLLIGAFTGFNGSFASHMTFALGTGSVRQVFTMDADGFNAHSVSPSGRVALAPTYGPNEELYYSASENKGLYKVYTSNDGPLKLNVEGSVYGIAFSPDRKQVAVAVGSGSQINLFVGPSLTELQSASKLGTVLRPGFTPSGKLMFAAEGKFGQQVYVDGKAISPEGIFASSPTFCKSPDGNRVVFAAGAGDVNDLVITSDQGGQLGRLTQGQGSNSYPACSPDGRLVAFFSTRTSGEGPGLYVMRIDGGGRAKRVSSLVGDSLRWDPLPPGRITDPNAGQAKKK
jgi:TolB protein